MQRPRPAHMTLFVYTREKHYPQGRAVVSAGLSAGVVFCVSISSVGTVVLVFMCMSPWFCDIAALCSSVERSLRDSSTSHPQRISSTR